MSKKRSSSNSGKDHISIRLPSIIKGEKVLQMENRIDTMLDGNVTRVDIDMQDVENIYSVLITVIMRAQKKIAESGGSLYLINVADRCRNQLESMNLDKILPIDD